MRRAITAAALCVGLSVAGCSASPPPSQPDPVLVRRIADLQEANDRLQAENEALKEEQQRRVMPGQIRFSREDATAIVRQQMPYEEIIHVRKVEFMLRNPDRWVAVWVFDAGQESNPSTVVVDAFTGDVVNATSPHSGQ